MNHCWHKTQLAGGGFVKSYDGEVCCFCGEQWSTYIKQPRNGHGAFDPDPQAVPRPHGPCAHQQPLSAPPAVPVAAAPTEAAEPAPSQKCQAIDWENSRCDHYHGPERRIAEQRKGERRKGYVPQCDDNNDCWYQRSDSDRRTADRRKEPRL